MQTPRFSGQPINAGDFVLVRTPSRPILTNCENVGTVFPLYCGHKFSPRLRASLDSSRRARRKIRARAHYAERRTAIPETSKKLRTHPKRENYSLGFDSERLTRLCGTGVPFRPLFSSIPSCTVPEEKILPTTRAIPPARLLPGRNYP